MGEINVVPYIDVMLVLLIIFMVTAPLLTQGIKVELPKAGAEPLAVKNKQNEKPLVLSIDSAGRLYLNVGAEPNQPVDEQVLLARTVDGAGWREESGLPHRPTAALPRPAEVMSEHPSDRWWSIGFAVVVHLVIAGALGWGYWHYKHPEPQPQRLAIEATVVDASSLPAGTLPAQTVVTPEPAVTPPEPQPVPEPVAEPPPQKRPVVDPAKAERERKALERAEAQKDRAEAKLKAAETLKRERAEKDKAAQAQAVQDKAAREKAAQDKVAKEKTLADAKAREEAERVARDKAESDRQKTQRESELRARLAAEEHLNAAQASGQMAQYQAQIRARIERAWIRPASARPGLSCEVRITQVQGGEVVGVQVGSCNGDESVRQSIEAAAYRASPLPQPPDAALFDRNLVVTFKPQD
jgi:colicin import membrane protein